MRYTIGSGISPVIADSWLTKKFATAPQLHTRFGSPSFRSASRLANCQPSDLLEHQAILQGTESWKVPDGSRTRRCCSSGGDRTKLRNCEHPRADHARIWLAGDRRLHCAASGVARVPEGQGADRLLRGAVFGKRM